MSNILNIINEEFNKFNNNIVRSVNTDSEFIDKNVKYNNTIDFKPRGLWYQINDSWVEFCSYYIHEKLKKYNLILNIDLSKIYIINNEDDAKKFISKYKTHERYIDWGLLAIEFSGIEINNINKVRDIDHLFEIWDIDSGCIWDLNIIKDYKKVDCKVEPKNDIDDELWAELYKDEF